MSKKSLSEISDYADLVAFVHSGKALNATDEEIISFYTNMPEEWKQTMLNNHAPSPEAEKAIVLYGDDKTFNLLCVRYGL